MKKSLKSLPDAVTALLLLVVFGASSLAAAAAPELTPELLAARTQRGIEYFAREQAPDGSWTKLVHTSSVIYNCYIIFLYEFLGRTAEKKPIVDGLIRYVWSQQDPDGGFPGYSGGPSNLGISVLAYVAGKIAGEDERSPQMLALESFIHSRNRHRDPADRSSMDLAIPFLMAFGIDSDGGCIPGFLEAQLLSADRVLPWVKAVIYPFFYLYSSGRIHALSADKFPARLGQVGACPRWLPHPLRGLHLGEKKFWRWIDARMNDDGTFFDYTPTTIPALMALSTDPGHRALLEKGVRALEGFQEATPDGVFQAPGEASVGETDAIVNALLELGADRGDSGDPAVTTMLDRAEMFLRGVEQPSTGAFGFSKHNMHFPDSDDTANSISSLTRIASLRESRGGASMTATERASISRGMDWLLGVQNKDGGFATWERERLPWLDRLSRRSGFVLTGSVTEHTGRILEMLALKKEESPAYARAYERAVRYLVKVQGADGSYPGTWLVDYLAGTSMALAGLGTVPRDAAHADAQRAIEKALAFLLSRQNTDGGFSESPESFVAGRSVSLEGASSPAQTGMVASELLTFLREEGYAHWRLLQPALERAVEFLLRMQKDDGLWHDPTWTGVTFPKVEYLVYPYLQELYELQALGMYGEALRRTSP